MQSRLDKPHNECPMPHVNIIFDMDGVLVPYDETAYTGPNPLFEQLHEHYFYKQPADMRAMACAQYAALEPWSNVYICSQTSRMISSDIGREQYIDKRRWCENHVYPYFEPNGVIVSHSRKEISAKVELGRELTPYDVLIDDFNENLIHWENAGGSAIKWLNGQNDAASWHGVSIDPEHMSIDTVLTLILRQAHRHPEKYQNSDLYDLQTLK